MKVCALCPAATYRCSISVCFKHALLRLSSSSADHSYLWSVSSDREVCYRECFYALPGALALLILTPIIVTTPHDYHESIVYAMNHASLRCKHSKEEYVSPLPSLGPIYQTQSSRIDSAASHLSPYAQSSVTTDKNRSPYLPHAKHTPTAHEAHNTGSVSEWKVRSYLQQRALE